MVLAISYVTALDSPHLRTVSPVFSRLVATSWTKFLFAKNYKLSINDTDTISGDVTDTVSNILLI